MERIYCNLVCSNCCRWDNDGISMTLGHLPPYLKCSNCYIHGHWCSNIQKVKNVHFLVITRYGKWSENILNTFLATCNTTTRQEQNMKICHLETPNMHLLKCSSSVLLHCHNSNHNTRIKELTDMKDVLV